jgi:hypothetical protein
MKLALQADVGSLTACLPEFLTLAGPDRWKKRAAQLAHDLSLSPALAKIYLGYHWLELALSGRIVATEAGTCGRDALSLETLAALEFAQMVVEAHRKISCKGQNALLGRVRDSLKSDNGFASLYLELGIARLLISSGFDVELSDLEGIARYDLRFWNSRVEGEVECKSLSVDAGRKIHRRDFYRFIDSISPRIAARSESGASEILVITLDDRLPSHTAQQLRLRAATRDMLESGKSARLQQDFFTIDRDDFSRRSTDAAYEDVDQFYKACRSAYGDNCHVSGIASKNGRCFVAMRSRREDDHSKPLLDALKRAASQFSMTRPSFIAVQFDDITPRDLLLTHLRRRIGLLSYYLFHECPAQHVLATCFFAYNGLSVSARGIGAAGIAIPNPKSKFNVAPTDYPPFLVSMPDAEFAALVGGAPPIQNLSYIPFEPKKP